MFAVLVAGSIGYVLSGWSGVAVGACAAAAVSVLANSLTPVGDQWTAHERRMRLNRRYRVRYEALEQGWRTPDRSARAATRRRATVRAPKFVSAVVVDPELTVRESAPLAALAEPAPLPALVEPEPIPTRRRRRSPASADEPKAAAAKQAPKPAAKSATKPTTRRKRAAEPKPAAASSSRSTEKRSAKSPR